MLNKIFPISDGLKESLKLGYTKSDFLLDLSAGFVVSLIALPLSMALAIAVNLPPQHGIYTAIIAGFITALLGGSRYQVSGPTAAFVVILAPIVTKYGLRGLIIAQIMAGFIIIIAAITHIGRLIKFVPHHVVTGFTSGIALVLACLSINDFFGLGLSLSEGSFLQKLIILTKNLYHLKPQEAFIGIITLLILIYFKKINNKIPASFVAVVMASLIAYFFNKYGIDVSIIKTKFNYIDNEQIAHLGVPPGAVSFHFFNNDSKSLFFMPSLNEIRILFIPAVIIAALAALESLLSAKAADKMAGCSSHNPDAELIAIGTANIITPFFMGIPVTGAIARTSANIKNGAKSPIAAMIHSVFILLYIVFFVQLINFIPMTSLAAVLLITAYQMSHSHEFINVIFYKNFEDKLVLLTSFILTIFTDMVTGVGAGIMMAIVIKYLKIQRLRY
jgi:SulP family sulfate permease